MAKSKRRSVRYDPTFVADMTRLLGGLIDDLSPERVSVLEDQLGRRPWRYATREIVPGWYPTDEHGDAEFGFPEWVRGQYWVGYRPSFYGGPLWEWGTNSEGVQESGFASPLKAIARVEAVDIKSKR